MVETHSGWLGPQEELMGAHNGKVQGKTSSGMAGSRGSNHASGELASVWALFTGRFLPPVRPAKGKESLEALSGIPFSCGVGPPILFRYFQQAWGGG